MRAASTQTIETAFQMTFAAGTFDARGDAAEKITERLARFSSGAAYVSATAKVEESGWRTLRELPRLRTPDSVPLYELRVRRHGSIGAEYEVWQVPAICTPQITSPLRIAGLRGRNLELVEHRILKWLTRSGVNPTRSTDTRKRGYTVTEDVALMLGLLFRTLAPMRSRQNMRAVAEGIEAMGREEAAYWLGMAVHRKYPRRVLAALRLLLTEPRQ